MKMKKCVFGVLLLCTIQFLYILVSRTPASDDLQDSLKHIVARYNDMQHIAAERYDDLQLAPRRQGDLQHSIGHQNGTKLSTGRRNVSHTGMSTTHGTMKTIQWYDFHHNGHGLRTRGKSTNFRECKVKNCVILRDYIVEENYNRSEHSLEADAVLLQYIHCKGIVVPPVRRDGQVFVMAEREAGRIQGAAPSTCPVFDHVFNWTMTYRHDSDILMPYGKIRRRDIAPVKNFKNIFRKKSKDVVWLVSHCDTHSKREQYVEELRKFIDVDIYGDCGTFQCEPFRQGEKMVTVECIQQLVKDYKFHLSFENNFHKDYVTEKLFDWMRLDIVSITMGAANYSDIAPLGSYIDVADFKTPRHLAEYLNTLKHDESRYIDYLSTKNKYYVESTDTVQQAAFCQLCEMLNNVEHYRKTYKSIHRWWANNQTVTANKYLETKRTGQTHKD